MQQLKTNDDTDTVREVLQTVSGYSCYIKGPFGKMEINIKLPDLYAALSASISFSKPHVLPSKNRRVWEVLARWAIMSWDVLFVT